MPKRKDLRQVVSRNLKYFMAVPGCEYRNANLLAKKASVAPNTVRNFLDPKKRTVTTTKPDGFPTLDKLEKLAEPLKCEVWELLHPDIERSMREREMYKKIENNYKEITSETVTSS